MKKLPLVLLLSAFLPLFPPEARAQLIFSPALSYSSDVEKADTSTTVNVTGLRADLRLGYAISGFLYVGGMYKYENGTSPTVNMTASATGASVGFVGGSWSLMGTYFLNAQRKYAPGLTYSGGKGYQIDLAYAAQMGDSFSLGPDLAYRNVSYTKASGGTGPTSDNFQIRDITPEIIFIFRF